MAVELFHQEITIERSRVQILQNKCNELEKQNTEYKTLLSKLQSINKKENIGFKDNNRGKIR